MSLHDLSREQSERGFPGIITYHVVMKPDRCVTMAILEEVKADQ